jgi:hypothetical protein
MSIRGSLAEQSVEKKAVAHAEIENLPNSGPVERVEDGIDRKQIPSLRGEQIAVVGRFFVIRQAAHF